MKRVSGFCLGFFIIILSFASGLQAATYYVDATNGNDYNDGLSSGKPWKTIAQINSARFNPGDSILFKRGESWNKQLIAPSSGINGKPITFGAYGLGENPIIDGSNNDFCILSNKSYVNYSDLILRNSGSTGLYFGGNNQEANNITSQYHSNNGFLARGNNLIFWDCTAQYNKFYGFLSDNSDSITLVNFKATHNSKTGILFNHVSNINISGGSASYNGTPSLEGNGINFQNACEGAIVNDFESHHNWGNGISIIDGCRNIRISGGEYHHNANGPHLCSGVRFDTNTSESVVMYVKSYWNESAGLVMEDGSNNNTIAYNLFYSNTRGMTHSNEPGSGNTYYNNVCYSNSDSGMSIVSYLAASPSATIKNNIFFNNGCGMKFNAYGAAGSHDIDHNLYYNNSSGAVDYDGTTYSDVDIENGTYYNNKGYEQHGIGQNPLFVNPEKYDFTLQSPSPCVDAGTDVGFLKDFHGTSVPQGSGVDIGAFEYREDTNPPLPPTGLKIQ